LQSQRQAYTDWLQKARAAAKIEDFWTAQKVPKDTPPTFVTEPAPASAPAQ
jgi:hypothetical protein